MLPAAASSAGHGCRGSTSRDQGAQFVGERSGPRKKAPKKCATPLTLRAAVRSSGPAILRRPRGRPGAASAQVLGLRGLEREPNDQQSETVVLVLHNRRYIRAPGTFPVGSTNSEAD